MTLSDNRNAYKREWYKKNLKRLRVYKALQAKKWRFNNNEEARENDRLKRIKYKDRIKNYEQSRKKRKSDPLKVLARTMLNNAIKLGKVTRPKKCQKCRSTIRIHAHHTDYYKPLEVTWLCSKCHALEHHPIPLSDLKSFLEEGENI